MSITINAAATALNRFRIQYANEIQTKLYEERTSEQVWAVRTGDHSYATKSFTGGSIVQPWQCDFTPNNDGEFDSALYTLRKLKIDVQFTCEDFEQMFDTFFTNWHQWGEGKELTQWDLPRWIYQNHIIPQVSEDLELHIAYKGLYAQPTAGTAGAVETSVTGLGDVIAQGITSGAIPAANVINIGGAFAASTYYDQIMAFIEGMPEKYKMAPGVIYMSDTHARGLKFDLLAKFGNTGIWETNPLNPDVTNKLIDFVFPVSNKRIMGLPSMRGQNRIYFSARNQNVIWGYRRGTSAMPSLRWDVEKGRTLNGFAEFWRFYGIEDTSKFFCNEVA